MKTESEKGSLEKRLVDLQTRMKHLTEHSRFMIYVILVLYMYSLIPRLHSPAFYRTVR